jgi:hypothetical protein
MVAISASVLPARANRVTAVPRRSSNVTPSIPARLRALLKDERKPCSFHGLPRVFRRMHPVGALTASSAAFSGAPTGSRTFAELISEERPADQV